MSPLAGQRALVTGASSGIGAAIVTALTAAGVRVEGIGRQALPGGHRLDLGDPAAIAAFGAATAAGAPVDILVHAAGVYEAAPLAETPADALDLHWQINARAPYLLTQALLPHLRRPGAQIAFVNSSVWGNAQARLTAYAASKFALKAIADGLRAEIGRDGIRVISLFPGRTATPMQAAIFQAEGRAYEPARLLQPQAVADSLLAALGLPATAEVTDLYIRPAYPPI